MKNSLTKESGRPYRRKIDSQFGDILGDDSFASLRTIADMLNSCLKPCTFIYRELITNRKLFTGFPQTDKWREFKASCFVFAHIATAQGIVAQ
jgi:hypothetical protein